MFQHVEPPWGHLIAIQQTHSFAQRSAPMRCLLRGVTESLNQKLIPGSHGETVTCFPKAEPFEAGVSIETLSAFFEIRKIELSEGY